MAGLVRFSQRTEYAHLHCIMLAITLLCLIVIVSDDPQLGMAWWEKAYAR